MPDLPEEAVEGLPPELGKALRDLSVLVPQDQRLFELIAAYRDAPSDTTSAQNWGPFIAAIRKQERERVRLGEAVVLSDKGIGGLLDAAYPESKERTESLIARLDGLTREFEGRAIELVLRPATLEDSDACS